MTTAIEEGNLTFTFPLGWQAEKYDETSHYRKHFQSLADCKAVDIVALSPAPQRELWLIEVKDYRAARREKGIALFEEICEKVRDTLAGIFVVQRRPEAGPLYALAVAADHHVRIRVAVHLEQARKPSRLFPSVTDRANHTMKLRQVLRHVDRRAEMCEMKAMPHSIGWIVA
jgi:hypothetical protein